MRVAVVSDCHLSGPDDPNQRRLVAWLDRRPADRLVLLGDVFQHWWHFGARPFPAYAEVVAALTPWRGRLAVLPGNHDFHAPAFFAQALGATSAAPLRDAWDGLAVHLEHGDAADRSPGYRALSALLRGPAFAACVDRMGPERAWRFLGRLTGRGEGRPNPTLIAAQRARARALLAEGVGLVAFGHTHAPELTRIDGGWYANTGDWLRHHTVLRVDDGTPSLWQVSETAEERPFTPA